MPSAPTAFAALDALPLTAITQSPAFKVRASETLGKDSYDLRRYRMPELSGTTS